MPKSNDPTTEENYSQSISIKIPDAKGKRKADESDSQGHEVKKSKFTMFDQYGRRLFDQSLRKKKCEKRKRSAKFIDPAMMDPEQRERLYGTKRSPTVPCK